MSDNMKSHADWLRAFAKMYGSGATGVTPSHKTLVDAADEIDRLKAQVEMLLSALEDLVDAIFFIDMADELESGLDEPGPVVRARAAIAAAKPGGA